MSNQPVVKYAVFTQVYGEWRSEGFVHEAGEPASKTIEKMRELCEKENGPGTFRTHAFLDQPHKKLEQPDPNAPKESTESATV